MTAAVASAALKDIQEACKIGVEIGMRILQRISDARLCRKVDHDRKSILREQLLHCRTINQIQLFEAET